MCSAVKGECSPDWREEGGKPLPLVLVRFMFKLYVFDKQTSTSWTEDEQHAVARLYTRIPRPRRDEEDFNDRELECVQTILERYEEQEAVEMPSPPCRIL